METTFITGANGMYLKITYAQFQMTEEGSTVSCVVERTRGALGYVHVFYTISQIESEGINYLVDDFANASGTITFLPWQRSEVNSAACIFGCFLERISLSVYLFTDYQFLGAYIF
jgi:hypothetical protein